MTITMDEGSEFDSIWDEAKGYVDQGDYDKAIDVYKYVLVRYSDNPRAVEYAHAYLGDVLLTSRQHLDQAETHLKKAITGAPDNHHYHYLLGFVYSVKGKWPKAIRALKKAIALSPGNSEHERCLGWAMFNGGHETEGLDHLNSALELAPTDVHIMTDLGTAMLMLRDITMARQYAEDALRIDPTYDLAKKLAETVELIDRKLNSE
jgi:tetratricopeptide (TPR) repeat protein